MKACLRGRSDAVHRRYSPPREGESRRRRQGVAHAPSAIRVGNTPAPWRLCAAQQARLIQAFVHVHAALEAVENRSVTNRAEVFRNRPEWFFGGHPHYRIKSRETHGA